MSLQITTEDKKQIERNKALAIKVYDTLARLLGEQHNCEITCKVIFNSDEEIFKKNPPKGN